MVYASFWSRFASFWLDFLITSPLLILVFVGGEYFRLFNVYYIVPGTAFGFFYGVYLVRRFGATPGKRLMGLRIVTVEGGAVTYREAFLRYFPQWFLGIGSAVATILAVISLTDAQYFAPESFIGRGQVVMAAVPSWYGPLNVVLNIWIWSEFVVMLTNKKRRAIHDFIAGTVVIKDIRPTV